MFQLLQPIWLFALAGLSIPVIIHLWNQRPGKTLRVGSIALVTENAVSHKKSIRLTEILLLLLRCLLLACIAMALAIPYFKSPANNASKGWVLMSRSQLTATYRHFKPMVDSLLQAGLAFHYFEDGFAKESFEKALQTAADTIAVRQSAYRSIAALLNEESDAKLPLYIFTDNYLRNFTGNRSAVALNLHWFTYTPDTAAGYAAADTAALHITLYNHTYANDARYIKAALDAIQQFSKKNIITRSVTDAADIPASQDWLFFLSDEPMPADKKAGHVLQYTRGKAVPNASYILPAGKTSFDAIALYTSIIEKEDTLKNADIQWKDGFGHPLLTAQEIDNATYYWLHTHIDPAWNELPWSNNFPQMLYALLYAGYDKDALAAAADKTIIDSSQLMPLLLTEKEAGIKPVLFTETRLGSIFWLTAFVLFLAERCLSFYHRKIVANG